MIITKRVAKAVLGFTTDVELAGFFACTKQAVSAWPEDEPIPEGRQWQLRAKRPELFSGQRTGAAEGDAAPATEAVLSDKAA